MVNEKITAMGIKTRLVMNDNINSFHNATDKDNNLKHD